MAWGSKLLLFKVTLNPPAISRSPGHDSRSHSLHSQTELWHPNNNSPWLQKDPTNIKNNSEEQVHNPNIEPDEPQPQLSTEIYKLKGIENKTAKIKRKLFKEEITYKTPIKRSEWTTPEKEAVFKEFGKEILDKCYPGNKRIAQFFESEKNSILHRRSFEQVCSVVNNAKFRKMVNVSPQVKKYCNCVGKDFTDIESKWYYCILYLQAID